MGTNNATLLHDAICKVIQDRGGKIPFETFMEMALYHPQWGYYLAREGKWGRRGDYVTSPGVSPAFGRCLARQCQQMWRILGEPDPISIVEVGAGEGLLARDFLEGAREFAPAFFDALQYHAVDRNPGSLDRESLSQDDFANRIVQWESIDDLPGAMEGVVLSNELLDAFPVHWMHWSGGRLREIFVTCRGNQFAPVLDSPSSAKLKDTIDSMGVHFAEGQTFTMNLRSHDWIRRAGALLDRGFIVTVDYGDAASELYRPERSDSLLCYYQRSVSGDPFRHVGEQDITAHVDFTALMKAGEGVGLRTLVFTTQFYFLLGLGIEEELRPGGPMGVTDAKDILWNQRIKELIHPSGMGGTFKVLVQAKGIHEIVF